MILEKRRTFALSGCRPSPVDAPPVLRSCWEGGVPRESKGTEASEATGGTWSSSAVGSRRRVLFVGRRGDLADTTVGDSSSESRMILPTRPRPKRPTSLAAETGSKERRPRTSLAEVEVLVRLSNFDVVIGLSGSVEISERSSRSSPANPASRMSWLPDRAKPADLMVENDLLRWLSDLVLAAWTI